MKCAFCGSPAVCISLYYPACAECAELPEDKPEMYDSTILQETVSKSQFIN